MLVKTNPAANTYMACQQKGVLRRWRNLLPKKPLSSNHQP
jgi:hypothetical protein